MKAGSLWPGTQYAYQVNVGRGRELPLHAKRVMVLELKKTPIPGGQRSRTEVYVSFLDDEGSAITEGYYSNPQWVSAPDIVDFWDEYEVERQEILDKIELDNLARRRREEQRQREYNERYAITAVATFIRKAAMAMEQWERERSIREAEELREKHILRLKNVLITQGFKGEQLNFNGEYMYIPISEIERWLGIETFGQRVS